MSDTHPGLLYRTPLIAGPHHEAAADSAHKHLPTRALHQLGFAIAYSERHSLLAPPVATTHRCCWAAHPLPAAATSLASSRCAPHTPPMPGSRAEQGSPPRSAPAPCSPAPQQPGGANVMAAVVLCRLGKAARKQESPSDPGPAKRSDGPVAAHGWRGWGW
ncbi:hypothetical protein HaLaN_03391 [Haematococcus lacustris]|uniref:Uncharacterized protein n=1 Tax=Haematococcus lacustris TaxID=44745 RepID=A0A699YE59_HAELA|nr:hypothetical protein HaLaN_03391 [Haematococcus lacustris]